MKRRRKRGSTVSLFAFQDIITSVTGVLLLVMLLLALALSGVGAQPMQVAKQASAEVHLQELRRKRDELKSRVAETIEKNRQTSPAVQLPRSREALLEAIASLEHEIADLKDAKVDASRDLVDGLLQTQEQELARLRSEVSEINTVLEQAPELRQIVYTKNRLATKNAWLVDLWADKVLVGQPGNNQPEREFATNADDVVPRSFVNWAKSRNRSTEYFVLLVRPSSIRMYLSARAALDKLNYDIGFDLLGDATAVFAEE